MKTLFKFLMWAAMLLISRAGFGQCSAAFTFTDWGLGQMNFQASGNNTGGDSAVIFSWSFGDGTGDTILGASEISHYYTATDSFTVCLSIYDTVNHCTDQQCQRVFANMCSQAANFYYTQVGFGAYDMQPNTALQGGYTGLWNFGDGGNASGSSVQHQYTASGTYTLCYKVSGPGCADSSCEPVYVTLCQYTPTYHIDSISYNPLTVSFVIDNPLPGNTYQWNLNDGQYTVANSDSITYTFLHTGADTMVMYDISSPTGCSDSNVYIFTADRCGLDPSQSESSNGYIANFGQSVYVDSNGLNITSAFWVFPGGTPGTSTNQYPTVTYPAYGNYTDTLYITTSTGCIDTLIQSFAITPGQYNISGQITAGTSAGNGTVYLVIQDSVGKLALFDSTTVTWQVDSGNLYGGSYSFNNLLADTYYVKAALDTGNPDYANYLPTYYTSSLSWSTAAPVIITNNNLTANITLTPGANPGGPGFVAGYVSQGAGIVVHGNTGADGPARGAGDAIAGVQINLLTVNDDAVAYTYTDINGNYHFSNLAYGSYYVYAEELNKIPVHVPFTLSPSDSIISDLNLSINSDSSYPAAINDLNAIAVQSIYPNPVENKLEIQISSQQAVGATLKLFNMLGSTVISNDTRLSGGDNKLEMDMENLAAGIYQLQIQTNGQHCTYKVVKAK